MTMDRSRAELDAMVVALLTAGRESAELASEYIADSFPPVSCEEMPAMFGSLAYVLGQMLTIVNTLREVPEWGVVLDRFIHNLAFSEQQEGEDG